MITTQITECSKRTYWYQRTLPRNWWIKANAELATCMPEKKSKGKIKNSYRRNPGLHINIRDEKKKLYILQQSLNIH